MRIFPPSALISATRVFRNFFFDFSWCFFFRRLRSFDYKWFGIYDFTRFLKNSKSWILSLLKIFYNIKRWFKCWDCSFAVFACYDNSLLVHPIPLIIFWSQESNQNCHLFHHYFQKKLSFVNFLLTILNFLIKSAFDLSSTGTCPYI